MPAFNRDSSKVAALCTVGTNRFKLFDFDTTTMTRSNGRVQSNPPEGFQDYYALWSRTATDKFYGCAGLTLYEITVPPGSTTTWTNTVVHDFQGDIPGADGVNDYCTQQTISDDDNIFAFHYVLNGASEGYIVYRRSPAAILLHVQHETPDEVEIDKSGRWLVTCCHTTGTAKVWDLNNSPPTYFDITDYEPPFHRAMGSGFMVQACKTQTMCRRNFTNPTVLVKLLPDEALTTANRGMHYSLRGSDKWVLISYYKSDPLADEVASDQECFELSTGGDHAVRRYVHHRAHVWSDDYKAQPKANVSQDGRFIAWTSNWDGANQSARNDVYIARLEG